MPRQSVTLNIKNPDVYRAASRLAQVKGTTMTQAVLEALTAELARQPGRKVGEVEQMLAFTRRVAAMPILDSRSDDEILGYGPEGFLSGR